MSAQARQDHAKFAHALVARDVRRLMAALSVAIIDHEARNGVNGALQRIESRAWLALFYHHVDDVLIQDQDRYSDGRRVTTTIDWQDRFVTLVHCPDPVEGTSGSEADELS